MRLHLAFALITVVLLVVTLRGHKHRFGFDQVEKMAQHRAAEKYVPLPNALPPQLQNLTPQQEARINWKDDFRLWRRNGLPFQVDFYHISKAFPTGPRINTVDHKGAHPLAYAPTFFDFGGLQFNPPLPLTLPYAGFYLRYPLPTATEAKPNILNGFFTTQGASYFRALARDQVYGLSARALAIDTQVAGKPEEFPQFTDWWLYQPAPGATQLVLNAIIDSPSVAGAYEFTIHPGAVTSIDVHASLFFRQAVTRLGLAPFSSMYLYGENAKNHFGDNVYPEVHDSDGVLMQSGKGIWKWRPFQQSPQLQLYNFADENPKGFGLVQRDRNFQHYQDLDINYNVRPSVWVTPHGNWAKGVVQITQLPTNNKDTDNVIVFWRPDQSPKPGDRLDLDYTLDFYMNDATRPPLAYSDSTFINDPAPPPLPTAPPDPAKLVGPPIPPKLAIAIAKAFAAPVSPAKKTPPPAPPGTTPVQFLVDFMGDGIENVPANDPPDLDLIALPAGTVVRESKVEKNGYDNSWRVTFTIVPFKKHVPTELEVRLFTHNTVTHLQTDLATLQAQIDQAQAANQSNAVANLTKNDLPQKQKALHDAESRPLTETWTYTWHQ